MRADFEAWMKIRFPNMWLDFDEDSQFYYHDIVQHMFMAWNEADREIERLRYELDIYKGGMRSFATVEELMEDLNSP